MSVSKRKSNDVFIDEEKVDQPFKRGRGRPRIHKEGDTRKVSLTEEERNFRKTRLMKRKKNRRTEKSSREQDIECDIRLCESEFDGLNDQCKLFLEQFEPAIWWRDFCHSINRLLPVYKVREEDEPLFEKFFKERFGDFKDNEETRLKAQEGLARYLMYVVRNKRVEHPHMRRPSSKEAKSKFDDLFERLDDDESLYPNHYNTAEDLDPESIQYNYDDYPNYPCLGIVTLQCQVNDASNAFHVDKRLSCGSDLCPSFRQAWFGDGYDLAKYFDSMNLMTKAMFKVNENMLPHLFDRRRWITAFLANSSYKPAQFRPAAAKAIHRRLSGTKILDFCSGWGDRLAACFADDKVEFYLGSDPNGDLIPRYLAQCACYDVWRFLGSSRKRDESEAKARGRKHRCHKRVCVTMEQRLYKDNIEKQKLNKDDDKDWFPKTIEDLQSLIEIDDMDQLVKSSLLAAYETCGPDETWTKNIEGFEEAYDANYEMPKATKFSLGNGRSGYDFVSASTGFRCVLVTSPAEEIDWKELATKLKLPKFDLAFTSPPYSACETYAKGTDWEEDQAWKKYSEKGSKGFFKGFMKPLIDNVHSARNVLFEDGAKICLNFHDTPISLYNRNRFGLVEATFNRIKELNLLHYNGTICLRMARRPNCRQNPNLLRKTPRIYGEPAFVWEFKDTKRKQPKKKKRYANRSGEGSGSEAAKVHAKEESDKRITENGISTNKKMQKTEKHQKLRG